MAKKPEIDVQVQLLFQEAVKKLTNAVANAAANVKVGLAVKDDDLKKLLTQVQKFLDEKQSLQLFTKKAKINERELAAYAKRALEMFDKIISKHPGVSMQFKADTGKIKSQIDEFLVYLDNNLPERAKGIADKMLAGIPALFDKLNATIQSSGLTEKLEEAGQSVKQMVDSAKANLDDFQAKFESVKTALSDVDSPELLDKAKAEELLSTLDSAKKAFDDNQMSAAEFGNQLATLEVPESLKTTFQELAGLAGEIVKPEDINNAEALLKKLAGLGDLKLDTAGVQAFQLALYQMENTLRESAGSKELIATIGELNAALTDFQAGVVNIEALTAAMGKFEGIADKIGTRLADYFSPEVLEPFRAGIVNAAVDTQKAAQDIAVGFVEISSQISKIVIPPDDFPPKWLLELMAILQRIQDVDGKTVAIDVKADTAGVVEAVNEAVSKLQDKTVTVSAKFDGFDFQPILDSLTAIQDVLKTLNEDVANSDLSPIAGELAALIPAVETLTHSFEAMEAATDGVDIGKMFTDSLPHVQAFAERVREIRDALAGLATGTMGFSLTVPTEPFKSLTDKVEALTTAVGSLETALGSTPAGSGGGVPVFEGLDYADIQADIDKVNDRLADTQTLMAEVKRVVDTVDASGMFDDESATELKEEYKTLADQVDALSKKHTELAKELKEIDDLKASRANNKLTAEEVERQKALRDEYVATGAALNTVNTKLEELHTSITQFDSAVGHIEGIQSALNGVTNALRDMNMAGIPIPRTFTNAFGYVSKGLEGIKGSIKNVTGLYERFNKVAAAAPGGGGRPPSLGGAVRGAGIQAGKGLATAGGAIGNAATGIGGAMGYAGTAAAVAGGATLGIGAGAIAGAAAAAYVYKRWQYYQDAYLKRDIMINKQLSEMRVQAITQESQLRIASLQAAADVEKQRIKNQGELTAASITMNAADYEARKQILDLELQRLKTAKELEITAKRTAQIQEMASKQMGQQAERQAVGRQGTKMGYFSQSIETEHGGVMDDSVLSATRGGMGYWGAFGVSGQTQARRLKSLQATWERMDSEMNAVMEAKVNETIAEFDASRKILASMDVTSLPETLRKEIEETDKAFQKIQKEKTSQRGMEMLHTASMFTDEAYAMQNAIYDEETKSYTVMVNGVKKVGKWGQSFQDLMAELRESQSGEIFLAKQYAKDVAARERAAQETANRQKQIVEAQKNVDDAIVARIKWQQEQEKTLRDSFRQMHEESFGQYTQISDPTGASFEQAARMNDLRAKQETEMATARNTEEKNALRIRHRQQTAQMENQSKLEAKHRQELFELELRLTEDMYKKSLDREFALFSVRKENETKLLAAQLENRKRDVGLTQRMLDRALDRSLITADTYGKNRFDVERDLKLQEIADKYDKIITDLENTQNQRDTEAYNAEQKTFAEERNAMLERQAAKQREFEINLLGIKQDIETQNMKIRFAMALEQIKYEVQYRMQLEKQAKEVEKAGFTRSIWEAPLQAHLSGGGSLLDFGVQKATTIDEMGEDDWKKVGEALSARVESGLTNLNTLLDGYYGKEEMSRKKGEDWDTKTKSEQTALLKQWGSEAQQTLLQAKNENEQAWQDYQRKNLGTQESGDFYKTANFLADRIGTEVQFRQEKGRDINMEAGVLGYFSKDMVDYVQKASGKNWEETKAMIRSWRDEAMKAGISSTEKLVPFIQEKLEGIGARQEYVRNRKAYEEGTLGSGVIRQEDVSLGESFGDAVDRLNDIDVGAVESALMERGKVQEALQGTTNELLAGILTAVGAQTPKLIEKLDENGKVMKDEFGLPIMEAMKDDKGNIINDRGFENLAAIMMEGQRKQLRATLEGETIKDADRREEATLTQNQKQRTQERETNQQIANEAEKKAAERDKKAAEERAKIEAEQKKHQEKLNADLIKVYGQGARNQREIDTDFALDMATATSGSDWTKAIATRQRETAYNQQNTEMEARHRREQEQLEKQYAGKGVPEEVRARMEERQKDEKSRLDSDKKLQEGIANSMKEVGTYRGLVSEGTGNKEEATAVWERIQASAFGHVEDPAADAVINMDRNQKMQHANLMTALTMYLPQLVEGQLKGGKVELPQTLINAMTGRNQTIQTTHNLVQNISNNMRSGVLSDGYNGN